jgi:uncharacterized protein YfaS (alpha-2-macroglobulin family)
LPVSLDVYVKDRAPMVRFTGDSFVLPSTARRGIPIVSVNTESAKLKLYRIGDRNISSLLTSSQFLTQIDGYSEERIKDESGELVWQGSIEIETELNKEVVTSFPVDEALPQRKPGVYVLTASSPNRAYTGLGRARHAMVRRVRHRHVDLCRHGRAYRLRAFACERQASCRGRIATGREEQ